MARVPRPLTTLALLALLAALAPSHAVAATDFAAMSISELGADFFGNPNVQFVELRLDAAGQTNLANTRLTAFDKDGVASVLLLTPHGIANGTSGRTVLYATSDFETATGITPDFVIPPGVVSPKGMICWGGPGTASPPADPSLWDPSKPESYTDCVAYGGYPGLTRPSSGTPSSLAPGDGIQSLTRTQNGSTSGNNATDFALAPANPCNNANQCAVLVPTPTATVTTTPSVAPTSTVGPTPTVTVAPTSTATVAPTITIAPTPVATPGKAQLACRRAIIKAGVKFAAAESRARVTCETARLKGKTAGPCPDIKATTKITAADVKRTKAITKACGALPPADTGFGAACPGYTGACTGPIAAVADVSSCVDCSARRAGQELATAVYGAPADPAALKCQLALGTTVAGYYRTIGTLLAKSEDEVARGKRVGPAPDPKTAATIAAKGAKLRSALCRACGGSDKLCDGFADVSPATLGLTTCPDRTIPSGTACGGIAVADLGGVVECVQCLADFASTCTTVLFAHPAALPADCRLAP